MHSICVCVCVMTKTKTKTGRGWSVLFFGEGITFAGEDIYRIDIKQCCL